MDEMD